MRGQPRESKVVDRSVRPVLTGSLSMLDQIKECLMHADVLTQLGVEC
jgi:hypothetical protein